MDSDRLIKAFRDSLKLYDGRITATRHTETCWTLDYYSEDGGFIETLQLSRVVEDEHGISFDPNPVIDLDGERLRIFERLWPLWEDELRAAAALELSETQLSEQSIGYGLYWKAEPDLRTWCGNSLNAMEQVAERFGVRIEWELVERGGIICGMAHMY